MDDRATKDDKPLHPVWGKIAVLLFGLGTLGFLTAVDHQRWFHIRPASGTAAALTLASDPS